MKAFDVVVLTDPRYIAPTYTDPYIENVLLEDRLVLEALEMKGLSVTRRSWDDPTFDWSSASAVLFRTTWDYFERYDAFSNWLDRISDLTLLINSKALIYWNIDKHYLKDLERKGVNIPPTVIIEQGETVSLQSVCEQFPSEKDFVLKPCISGGAYHTYRFNSKEIPEYEAQFASLVAQEAMMLQVFQHKIVEQGELSLMLFGNVCSHGVRKVAKPGDFRVQDDFGGSVHGHTPTQQEIDFALQAVAACPEYPLYARVDIFEDNLGEIALAELELIEPELWFRRNEEAAQLLATAVVNKLKR